MTELSSYHNHSCWSDGVASPEVMYRAAKAAGLREFGLSDHWVIPPGEGYGADTWRLPVDRLLTHTLSLDDINAGFDRLARGEAIRQVVLFD